MWTLHVDDEIVAVVIFEVQTVQSAPKPLEWAMNAAVAAVEFRTTAVVVVDTIDGDVRRWAQKHAIHPPQPYVLSPENIERITSLREARKRPLETIWGGGASCP